MFAEHLRRPRPRRWVRIANCKGNLRDEGGQIGIGGFTLRVFETRLTVLEWQAGTSRQKQSVNSMQQPVIDDAGLTRYPSPGPNCIAETRPVERQYRIKRTI